MKSSTNAENCCFKTVKKIFWENFKNIFIKSANIDDFQQLFFLILKISQNYLLQIAMLQKLQVTCISYCNTIK